MQEQKLFIPKGVGFSKPFLISLIIGAGFFVILFLFFLNHYSPKRRTENVVAPTTINQDEAITMMKSLALHAATTSDKAPVSLSAEEKGAAAVDSLEDNDEQTHHQEKLLKEAGDAEIMVANPTQQTKLSSSASSQTYHTIPHQSSHVVMPQFPSDAKDYAMQNAQPEKEAFLKTAPMKKTFISPMLHKSPSPYIVTAGAIIPATLVTGINSDLPGQLMAKVRRDVFDSTTGNHLLIPQGTTLIGLYDSRITYGQKRLLIAWSRMIFPNGSSMKLEGMPGVDLKGMAGLHDTVDNHYPRIFGSAILMSLLSAAGQLSQPQGSHDKLSNQQVIYGALGQELSQLSSRLIARNINIQPTIVIRPGAAFNVLLTRDLLLPHAYCRQEALRVRGNVT